MSKPPGEYVQEELDRRGWGQDDLARILGRPPSRVNELIKGKLIVSAELAIALEAALGETADEWMRRETAYRLSLEATDASLVKKRARLFEIAPVKEMVRRGWISDDPEKVEHEVMRFYGISDLSVCPEIHGAMRKTGTTPASPAQTAWAFRVRQIAGVIPTASVGKYDRAKLVSCQRDLKKLAPYSSEVKKVPAVLMNYGIRYVVVEGLAGAKMDGFATWLDQQRPVIGMSLRFDRLDSFWFTLCHELIHIKYEDVAPIDGEVGNLDEIPLDVKPEIERRADKEAAEMLVPPDELESFIKRVGPFYSAAKINQLANRIKIHPNIIIGQLKHRGQIPRSHHNKSIVPIRDTVSKAALCDGWGQTMNSGRLK